MLAILFGESKGRDLRHTFVSQKIMNVAWLFASLLLISAYQVQCYLKFIF